MTEKCEGVCDGTKCTAEGGKGAKGVSQGEDGGVCG